jgi:uncharacterized protein
MDEQDEAEAAGPKAPRRRKREPKAPTPQTGGADVLGDFLTSREGKALQKKVMRGVFGMLKKRL